MPHSGSSGMATIMRLAPRVRWWSNIGTRKVPIWGICSCAHAMMRRRSRAIGLPAPASCTGRDGQDPLGLRTKELAPGRTVSPGSGPEPVRPQQRANLGRRGPDPELGELAPDSYAPPPGVLPSHRQDELSNLVGDRWPAAGRPRPEGPHPPHELPVPPKERLRPDQDEDHRARGRTLLIAAMNRRSRRRRCGLATWRLRTFS